VSRVNQVKKILRDHGVEMDADDILHALKTDQRRRGTPTRTQVMHSLADLHATDPDITRTRRGLYRYHQATTPPRPPALPEHGDQPRPAGTSEESPLLIIDLGHVRAELTDQLDTSLLDDTTLLAHTAHLAARRLRTRPRTAPCTTPQTVIATVVAALLDPAPILLIANPATTCAARILADQLDRTITTITPSRHGSPSQTTTETRPAGVPDPSPQAAGPGEKTPIKEARRPSLDRTAPDPPDHQRSAPGLAQPAQPRPPHLQGRPEPIRRPSTRCGISTTRCTDARSTASPAAATPTHSNAKHARSAKPMLNAGAASSTTTTGTG
jgi:hypothetical protein